MAVRGELDLAAVPVLERELDEHLAASNGSEVVLDLGECTFVDASGAGALIKAAVTLDERSGASIRLANLRGQARAFFSMIEAGRWLVTEPEGGPGAR